MPHSAIKFKNEKDYSFFSQTENIGNQSEFIELHLEKMSHKSDVCLKNKRV